MLVVTSNYFRRFCDKRQHLLDVCTPSLDAGAAVCLVHSQRQVCVKFIQFGKEVTLFKVSFVALFYCFQCYRTIPVTWQGNWNLRTTLASDTVFLFC